MQFSIHVKHAIFKDEKPQPNLPIKPDPVPTVITESVKPTGETRTK